MPVDLMYGASPTDTPPDTLKSTTEFAFELKKRLRGAYTRIRTQMGHKLDRQKRLYDKKVHGKPFQEDDLVWLHATVVPRGVGRKLHRPWSGPFRIVKKLSDSVYRLQNVRSSRHRIIVHFDRLKLCPEGIRLPTLPPRRSRQPARPEPPPPPGTDLHQVFTDDSPPPGGTRYPRRIRQPPDRLLPYVEH